MLKVILTPGNWDDRDPALALVQTVDGGVTLGDLGYRGPECARSLAEEAAMLLITRDRAPELQFVLSQVRQGIETTFTREASKSAHCAMNPATGLRTWGSGKDAEIARNRNGHFAPSFAPNCAPRPVRGR